jgi:hypothetical protein
VQAKLGADSRVVDAAGVATQSGRLRSVTLRTLTGSSSVPASLVRTALGLRSTWITIGVLRLDRPRGTVEFGSSLRLTGIARNLAAPQLAASTTEGVWAPVGALDRAVDGGVSRSVRPTTTTRYRIEGTGETGPVVGQVLLVRVSPRVRLTVAGETGVLKGTVRPRIAGAVVQLERQQGTGWAPVGEAPLDGTGAFRFDLALAPGSYRARVGPTSGYVEGLSPAVQVDA